MKPLPADHAGQVAEVRRRVGSGESPRQVGRSAGIPTWRVRELLIWKPPPRVRNNLGLAPDARAELAARLRDRYENHGLRWHRSRASEAALPPPSDGCLSKRARNCGSAAHRSRSPGSGSRSCRLVWTWRQRRRFRAASSHFTAWSPKSARLAAIGFWSSTIRRLVPASRRRILIANGR